VPTVLANEARVVVDAEVDSSHELAPMHRMLDRQPQTMSELLLDAGFRSEPLLSSAVARDVNVLVPAQGGERGRPEKKSKYYPVDAFRYESALDVYHCPAGEVLKPMQRYRKQHRVRYTSKACPGCPLKEQCTRGKRRIIERTAAMELREGLIQLMSQPKAQARYAKRKAWVEPVFSSLRDRQRLNRFRRKGLSSVRVEFRLHVMAYNLSRVVALMAHSGFFRALRTLLRCFAGRINRRKASPLNQYCLHHQLQAPA